MAQGSLDGAQILRPESVQEMWRRQYEPHPSLNGQGLVFYQETRPGWPNIIGHRGGLGVFYSDLFLIPEAGVGVFVSYNSQGEHAGRTLREIRDAFLERYFARPVPAHDAVSPADAKRDAPAVAGQYVTTRRTESSFLKFGTLLFQTTVSAHDDGSLTVSGAEDLHGHSIRWQPVGGLVYQEKDGRARLAFRQDTQGQEVLVFDQPFWEATRVPWYESQALVGPLVLAACAALLVTALCWPVAAVMRRYYGLALVPEAGAVRTLFVLGRVVCVLNALVLVGWVALLNTLNTGPHQLGDLHTLPIRVLQALGWGAVIGTGLLLAAAVALTASQQPIRRWPKIHQWLLVAAGGVFVCFVWYWHFLGP